MTATGCELTRQHGAMPMSEASAISRPPTACGEDLATARFRGLTYAFAWLTVVAGAVHRVRRSAVRRLPAMQAARPRVSSPARSGTPTREQYGILPQIWGTLYSSVLAVIIGTVLGLAVAIFLSERFLSVVRLPHPEAVRRPVPSVLGQAARSAGRAAEEPGRVAGGDPQRGLRAVGHLRGHPLDPARPAIGCTRHLGWIPLFGTPLSGPGMLPAAMVLAIMILPTISAISRDALGERAAQAARGGLRAGRHALGGHPGA